MVSKRFLSGTFIFILILFVLSRQSALADCRLFSSQLDNGSYAVADHTGGITSSCNADKKYIPASIIKIPLALAALDILGPEFRFSTEFFVDSKKNLFVRGQGDPFLISEEVELIVDRLLEKGLKAINNIVLDTSLYKLERQAPGRGHSGNPYDVPVSALAVNFNTVFIRVHKTGLVESAEPQTPTVPIMLDLARDLPPGLHRVNICQDNCLSEQQSSRYFFELFRALFNRRGVAVKGGMKTEKVPGTVESFYVHTNTKTLEDVVFAFLKFSNNFVANQVFLQCGIKTFDVPATWEKARESVAGSLQRVLGSKIARQIVMHDGAGLSRRNRVTADAMLNVLGEFKRYAHLLQEKKEIALKSGTLDGVYNYAGYLINGNPFVIMLNQATNTRDVILQMLNQEIKLSNSTKER